MAEQEREKYTLPDQNFEMVECFFVKTKEGAKMPTYSTDGAGACDFYTCFGHSGIILWPGKKHDVPLGIAVEIPLGYRLRWEDRSGMSKNYDITHRAGYIDCDFRGELTVSLINNGNRPYSIKEGDRVIQGELLKIPRAKWTEVDKLSETKRGEGGFGSTGR